MVKFHASNNYAKLGARNRTEAVSWFLKYLSEKSAA